ncbi:MAG TPA: MYXO-CTERM sorting domain-containing protein [Kofleriaceae bacterium]|jgi:uncharacterized protein (TIGR03382 family)
MRVFALAAAGACVLAGGRDVAANGRAPATSTIHWEQGDPNHVVAGMTFGVLLSSDGGATWHWMCEKAVGYSGMYDPIYAYTSTGALFATTFGGLTVLRQPPAGDGCTFAATPPGSTFVSQDVVSPDGSFYYAASSNSDTGIYRSMDDGMTFPQSAMPGLDGDWWETLRIAPSDPMRVYLAGYRFTMACNAQSSVPYQTCTGDTDCMDDGHPNGSCEGLKKWLLYESTDGGKTFSPLPGNLLFAGNSLSAGLTTASPSAIDFVGVDATNENILYARSSLENGTVGDGIYKIDVSSDTTWTHVLSLADGISFVARASGELVIATPTLGAQKSEDHGTTWTPLSNAPHINCLYESPTGVVWACTANYGNPPSVPSDGYGIMTSTDLSAWTGLLKFQDIEGPVMCPAGTVEQDQCVADLVSGWCGVKLQLGITSNVIMCPQDQTEATNGDVTAPKKGCCDASGGPGVPALFAGLFGAALLLRRRRPKLP